MSDSCALNHEAAKNTKSTKTSLAPLPAETERIAKIVVDCIYTVHRALGPGLLESVYETCLLHEMRKRGLKVDRQTSLPIVYDGIRIDAALRIDLMVEDCVILELKAADQLLPIHRAQLITYLRLTGKRLGLLVNFNVPLIKDGIRRVIL